MDGFSRDRLAPDFEDPAPEPQDPKERSKLDAVFSFIVGDDPVIRKIFCAILILVGFVLAAIVYWAVQTSPMHAPVYVPPQGPMKERPSDPGGLKLPNDELGDADKERKAKIHLAPPPEMADPDLLRKALDGIHNPEDASQSEAGI